ncbi:MAG: hypothetical protein ACPG5W_04260, partial [Flavobacteriales bacterium]
MWFLRTILIAFSALVFAPVFGQNLSSLRTQQIELNADTIQLDTLSVVPSSFVLNSVDGKIDTTKYE